MINDISTVFQKELKEILHMRNSLKATLMALFIPVIFIGVFFSISHGPAWVSSPVSITLWIMIPFIMVSGIIADSFAGERERHTLETLLASRLSESAILVGKISAAVVYGLSLAAFGALVSLITVSVTSGVGHMLMFTPEVLASGIMTGFLTALTGSCLGVLISLKASTARQAQQMLGFGMMFLFFTLIFVTQFVPEEVMRQIRAILDEHNMVLFLIIVAAIVITFDLLLFGIAWSRFKRWKMVLE